MLHRATSKDFNDIDKILQRNVKESDLGFGLSTLHAWIRFFECLLHLSFKLKIRKWQARDETDKIYVAEKKKIVQQEFKEPYPNVNLRFCRF